MTVFSVSPVRALRSVVRGAGKRLTPRHLKRQLYSGKRLPEMRSRCLGALLCSERAQASKSLSSLLKLQSKAFDLKRPGVRCFSAPPNRAVRRWKRGGGAAARLAGGARGPSARHNECAPHPRSDPHREKGPEKAFGKPSEAAPRQNECAAVFRAPE